MSTPVQRAIKCFEFLNEHDLAFNLSHTIGQELPPFVARMISEVKFAH